MEKFNIMLNPQSFYNFTNAAPQRREANQFIRRHHVKNKLSLDNDLSYSQVIDSLSSSFQKDILGKEDKTPTKFQTIDPHALREILKDPKNYSETIDVIPISYESKQEKVKNEITGPPPPRNNKTPNPRNMRHRNSHSIDYNNEPTIPIISNNIYMKKPPTPTQKNKTRMDGIMTTSHSKQKSRITSLEPVTRNKKASFSEYKDSGNLNFASEIPSTKESYTTLTSAFQSNEKLVWQESGYLEKDPNEAIKQIVNKHLDDAEKKINLIKMNFKQNNNKFLFQLYSGD